MSTSMVHYIVNGIYFDKNDMNRFTDDQREELLDNCDGRAISVSPMMDSSLVYGTVIYQSDNSRWEPATIDIFDVSDINPRIPEYAPDYLRTLYLVDRVGKLGIWVFTQIG